MTWMDFPVSREQRGSVRPAHTGNVRVEAAIIEVSVTLGLWCADPEALDRTSLGTRGVESLGAGSPVGETYDSFIVQLVY